MITASMPTKISAVLLIAASATLLSGCSVLGNLLSPTTEQRDDTGTIVDGGTTDVFTIAVGDCLNDSSEDTVSDVPTVPCTQAHANEVYAETTMDAGDYPGEAAVTAKGDEYCGAAFDAFAGIAYADSTLDYSYFYPTQESWTSVDDRLISCIIYDPNNTALTGTLAGAAR